MATVGMAEEGFAAAVKTSPDLIFLDVMLPDATGFQTLGRLRENPVTKVIPIIMMSGTARYDNQITIGKSMGANAYIVKPFNVVEVGEQARVLMGGKPQEPEPIETPDAPTPIPESETEPKPVPEAELKPEIP